jgi:hypothetical protein
VDNTKSDGCRKPWCAACWGVNSTASPFDADDPDGATCTDLLLTPEEIARVC